MIKKVISLLVLLINGLVVTKAQLTIEYCQQKARLHYPLARQYDLIEKSSEYSVSNLTTSWIPRLSLGGKATWQSDVPRFPDELTELVELIGADISFPSRDQYQFALELTQPVWDGGTTRARKQAVKTQEEAEKQSWEIDMQVLSGRVNELFFGILLLEEQLQLNRLLQEELHGNYAKVSTYITNGIAQQSDLDLVRVEILSAQRQFDEMKISQETYKGMLSLFIGEEIGESITLEKPSYADEENAEITRPELRLFDLQYELKQMENKTLLSNGMPRIALFAQGAYGNPGLNIFESGFKPYFIGGIQIGWNFGALYTRRNDRKLLENYRYRISMERDLFLFNTRQKIIKVQSEIQKLKRMLDYDREIMDLRDNVKKCSETKAAAGTLSVSDMMRDIHASNMAKQTHSLHEIQLLMALYNLRLESGR